MLCLRLFFGLLLIVLSFAGCQSVDSGAVSPGYDYFPLETGRYIIYDVMEHQYSLRVAPTQRAYQLKEIVGPAYTDVLGQPAYRLLRYRRLTDSQPWQTDSVWSARRAGNEAIRTENGLDFVKLLFPIGDRLRWNGNRYNAAGPDAYEARNSGQPYRVSDKQFSETVTVVAQQDSTRLSQDKRIEVYARQVGLIYKERVQLQFCTTGSGTQTCTGNNQIDYGIRQIYRIRSFGSE